MRKLLTLFALVFCLNANAQYVNIPDTNFVNYLIQLYPACFNSAGEMDTTCAAIVNEKNLYLYNSGITDLTGIQYFKSLTFLDCHSYGGYYPPYNIPNVIAILPKLSDSIRYLDCSGNIISSITNLPLSLRTLYISNNKLVTLPSAIPKNVSVFDCSNNLLTIMPMFSDSLRELYCQKNSLTSLPLLPDSLKILVCSKNQLTTLPNLTKAIDSIDCSSNKLTSLPLLNDSLSGFNCSINQLTSLPTLPNNLKTLNCDSNLIISLPAMSDSLKSLICSRNHLTVLKGLNDSLTTIDCSSNLLDTLIGLPKNLYSLNCSKNHLAKLPILNDSLKILDCSSNLLDTLIGLPNNLYSLDCSRNLLYNLPNLPTNLGHLFCIKNYLKYLPALPNSLVWLNCNYNQLSFIPSLPNVFYVLRCNHNQLLSLPYLPKSIVELDCSFNNLAILPTLPPNNMISLLCNDNPNLSCLPLLPIYFNPYYFSIANTNIKCVPNKPYWVSNKLANYPICNATNNINQCHSFPKIDGVAFTDYNSNGKKDSIEYFKVNAKIALSNSAYTFTNNSGFFEILADSIGSYTVSFINNNHLFNAVPSSYTHSFTSYDTLIIDTFALQPTVIKDSIAIKLTPTNWAARPGRSYPYLVSYENVGTTVLSTPTIHFNYDSSLLIYDSSSMSGVANNGNNLSLNIGNLVPGQTGSFVAYFTVKLATALGSNVTSVASISAGSANGIDSVTTIVRGSYDPNDKQATQSLTTQQVADGDYINYNIRFQNTGTDTAFNVVIADTLDSKLIASQMQMVGSSHNCKTTVKDNVIFFEFLNIYLPDSNINKTGSNGFVSFKIKPLSTVTNGTIIPNNAAIYFDYNTPVVTNTAKTIIQNSLSLTLLSFNAIAKNDNSVMTYWNTANEINTSFFLIEQSVDARAFNPVVEIAAKGIGSNSYFYSIAKSNIVYLRLKMIDKNGTYTYSNIIKLAEEKTNEFDIVNNPAKGSLNVKIYSSSLNNTIAKIVNVQGQIVKTFILKQNFQAIDIAELQRGMYYLQTTLGAKKFVVE